MGKLAENEKIKYAATFMNNIAAALIISGSFIPLFLILRDLSRDEFFSFAIREQYRPTVALAVFAVLAGMYLRYRVDRLLDRLKD